MLPYFERLKGAAVNFFIVFGRVPMFYYLLHIPLIHALAVIAAILTGHDTAFMFQNIEPWNWPGAYGFSLPVVYLVWVCVILALYPACRWFADLKRRRKDAWLSYF